MLYPIVVLTILAAAIFAAVILPADKGAAAYLGRGSAVVLTVFLCFRCSEQLTKMIHLPKYSRRRLSCAG